MPKANNKEKALAALIGTQTIKEAAKRANNEGETTQEKLFD